MKKHSGIKHIYKTKKKWVILAVASATLLSVSAAAVPVSAATTDAPVALAEPGDPVTIPVYFRDTDTDELLKTLSLTDEYDTEFSTRSEEIGDAVPTGYSIDEDRLPGMIPMYFGDPNATELTFYLKADDVTIPVYYRDSATGELLKTLNLTDKYNTEFSTRSEEIGANAPVGYTIDATRPPAMIPMYFGDPNATSLTFYFTANDVTIPVYYRDATTNALIKTVALTDKYNTEFSTRAGEIETNLPSGYTIDTNRLPGQLPMYFGDPDVTTLTIYINATATPDPDPEPEPSTPTTPTTPESGQGTDQETADTTGTEKEATTTVKTSDQKRLPATGEQNQPLAAGLGLITTIGMLFGLAATRRKRD